MKQTAIIFMFAAFASCNQHSIDTRAEGEKLMQVSREWSQAASGGDVEKIISYWADSAILFSPEQAPLRGKTAIRGMVEGSLKAPGFHISWEPESAVVSESGDLGYLLERTQITVNDSTGKPVSQYYNGITIWKKQQDGSWKNVVDILSADSSSHVSK